MANVYFLFNFSIITSTCPRQEVPLWDNNSLVVSFIISFHSQLPSTSPGKFGPKVKWQRAPFAPLSSPSISVDGGARRRGKPDGLTQLCTNAVIKTSQKSHLAGDIYSVTVLMIFFFLKKARHDWHNKAQHCWGIVVLQHKMLHFCKAGATIKDYKTESQCNTGVIYRDTAVIVISSQ